MNNDLISREAAIAQIERRKSLLVGDKTVPVDAFIKFLKNRPTVDAEPIRYGRWIKGMLPTYGGWKCSLCNRNMVLRKPNYCPNCGAKMDRGAEK